MPQLLHFFRMEARNDASADLDFATIAVYTCSASCGTGGTEVAYVQPPATDAA